MHTIRGGLWNLPHKFHLYLIGSCCCRWDEQMLWCQSLFTSVWNTEKLVTYVMAAFTSQHPPILSEFLSLHYFLKFFESISFFFFFGVLYVLYPTSPPWSSIGLVPCLFQCVSAYTLSSPALKGVTCRMDFIHTPTDISPLHINPHL